jgi:hypothetical protein
VGTRVGSSCATAASKTLDLPKSMASLSSSCTDVESDKGVSALEECVGVGGTNHKQSVQRKEGQGSRQLIGEAVY